MLGFRFSGERRVPVRERRHSLERTALFIEKRSVVKGDAEFSVALHQRGVQIVFVLVRQIFFQERVENNDLAILSARTETSRPSGCESSEWVSSRVRRISMIN